MTKANAHDQATGYRLGRLTFAPRFHSRHKDDLGRLGAVWREADAETADLETVINDLLSGQYKDSLFRGYRCNIIQIGQAIILRLLENPISKRLRSRCGFVLQRSVSQGFKSGYSAYTV